MREPTPRLYPVRLTVTCPNHGEVYTFVAANFAGQQSGEQHARVNHRECEAVLATRVPDDQGRWK